MDAYTLDLPPITDSGWHPNGPDPEPDYGYDGDPWARVLLKGGVSIYGVSFHVEGFAVQMVDGEQVADHGDDDLRGIALAVGADGPFETIDFDGRDYVLVVTPHCH